MVGAEGFWLSMPPYLDTAIGNHDQFQTTFLRVAIDYSARCCCTTPSTTLRVTMALMAIILSDLPSNAEISVAKMSRSTASS